MYILFFLFFFLGGGGLVGGGEKDRLTKSFLMIICGALVSVIPGDPRQMARNLH